MCLYVLEFQTLFKFLCAVIIKSNLFLNKSSVNKNQRIIIDPSHYNNMQTKFKRHDKVKLLTDPDEEYIEPYKDPPVPIKRGMTGTINILLPNGRYHVRVQDKNDEEIAYVVMDEESLEKI